MIHFRWALLVFLAYTEAHTVVRRSPDLTDLDRVAKDFVNRKSQEVNRRVSWWDIYGEHEHLRTRPQYHKFKVDISTSNVQYGEAIRSAERPQTVQKKTYVNRTNNTISSVITWETRHASSYTWRVDRGFKATWDVKIKTDIPGIGKPSNETTVSIDTSREQTVRQQESFSISYSIQVPPHTETSAHWIITERDQEVPFGVDVFVRGYVAVWFSEKWEGHWLWFYPVTHMKDPKFVPFENGLRFRSSGVFRGVRGVDSHIEVTETSLTGDGKANRLYTISGNQPVHGE